MIRRILGMMLVLMLLVMPMTSAWAAGQATDDMKRAQQPVSQALAAAQQGKLAEAKQQYEQFNSTWREVEDGVKDESRQAYKDIESKMGKVVYAFSRNDQAEVSKALQGLTEVNEKFIRGEYPHESGEENKQVNLSLGDFIGMLKDTKQIADKQEQQAALDQMNRVTDSWLSVEGVVVSQSSKVYGDSERDLVTVQAMLANNPPDYVGAGNLLEQMIDYLTPLAAKSGYTMWDAAMIIIREGLEALLVITALLAFVNKSNSTKGKSWIWTGVLGGLLVSVVLGVIVKFVFASGAFGNNNALIGGWTAVIAAVMLLYVSYWLHNNSSIAQWNQFIRAKSQAALTTGKMVSLGVISFLAIFREGTETVLFFIGMVNQISLQDMLIGLLIGFAILVVLAYAMIFVGVKLPVRPFFMVSSVIVFYLCLKFTGLGVHSLQMAGMIPTTQVASIPSMEWLALYPSLESALPQLALVLLALVLLFKERLTKNKQPNAVQH